MKIFGSGYRNCYNGVTYGFSRPIGDDTEMVFVEYRRIPKKHNKAMVVDVLGEKYRRELRDVGDNGVNESSGFGKKIDRRLAKWAKQLVGNFEASGGK